MAVAAAFLGVTAGPASAEGDETLGDASITIADGTGFASGGIGMFGTGAGTITVDVPAGATVKQVLLYWDGQVSTGSAGDDTAVVEGTTVTGTSLSSAALPFFPLSNTQVSAAGYRADITSLDLVGPGSNSIEVSGLNFNRVGKNITNGAGVLVVYDDGSGLKDLVVRDGVDTAYIDFAPPNDTTTEQTYTFDASSTDREATFTAFASSVFDSTGERPNALRVVIDGVETTLADPFSSDDGLEYDTYETTLTIPAGATTLTLQALSVDDGSGNQPASLVWTMGALALPAPTVPPTTSTSTTSTTVAPTTTTVAPTTSTTAGQTETTLPPTTTTVPPTTSTTVGASLPKTGNNTMPLVFAGLGLVLVGGAAVLGVRRFRTAA
jgi:LPXTG-motif cell wall-anchored protein